MDAKKLPGMVLSDIPGTKEDAETVCKDESGVCDPQITQITLVPSPGATHVRSSGPTGQAGQAFNGVNRASITRDMP